MFFEKILKQFEISVCVGKNILYCMILKIIFQKMKSSKIDQWQLEKDYFFANFRGL